MDGAVDAAALHPVAASSILDCADYLVTYPDALSFLTEGDVEGLSIFDRILQRSLQDDWQETFAGFCAQDLKVVAENGVEVHRRVGGKDMVLAKNALLTMFKEYLEKQSPSKWSNLFKEASKTAYNLQYMFREDVAIATDKFRTAISLCVPAKKPFGDSGEMFSTLLEAALDKYGENGLIDQVALSQTNFTTHPEELVATVRQGVANADAEVKLLGELAANWMEMLIAQGRMPLTPHHTQVLAMLMFSGFKQMQQAFSKSVSEGGYNYNAAILQMKTGEGKSIVIAMLATFVVQYLQKRVHVLENNEGLLERDYASYKPFYDRFNISTNKEIDNVSQICYCLKKQNNKFFNKHLVDGTLDLSNIVLIVDEVDDLVVNEEPTLQYMKHDVEKTPDYRAGYDAITKPSELDGATWRDCERIKADAAKKVEGKHFAQGSEGYLMLDANGRLPKVPLMDDWLAYLNYKKFNIKPSKNTFYTTLCTPYMYTKYACIFGLTGSVGGDNERAYIKNTYKAVPYEVPQFLTTCRNTNLTGAVNLGVHLEENAMAQMVKVVELAAQFYKDVPVLIISRHSEELNNIYSAVEQVLVDDESSPLEKEHLLKFRERDDEGKLLTEEWGNVVEASTQRHGTEDSSHCCITITDYFGGRGHDFNVMDPIANAKGGMLVIATTVPDTREWIQWKGRTARQDRPGQYYVILSKTDPPFVGSPSYIKKFECLTFDERIYDSTDGILQKQDAGIRELLQKYSSSQAKGAWLNELCEKFYKKYPRNVEETSWPSEAFEAEDRKLREMLSRGYVDGAHLRTVVASVFSISLVGPPAEWNFPANKVFDDAYAWSPTAKSMVMVVDLSDSMSEVVDDGTAPKHICQAMFVPGDKGGTRRRFECPNCKKGFHELMCPEGTKVLTENLLVNFSIFDVDNKLGTCKKSIAGIIKDNCEDSDRVGLVTFANDVQTTIKLVEKRGKERAMLNTVGKLQTRGETAFYSAVLEGINTLLQDDDPDMRLKSKWVVALTDGLDNKSKEGDFEMAVELLQNTPKLNFALVTVGKEGDKDKFQQLVDAAKGGAHPSDGMLVPATNTQAIADAFEEIAKKMNFVPSAGAM